MFFTMAETSATQYAMRSTHCAKAPKKIGKGLVIKMPLTREYKTKQRQCILDCLKSLGDRHVTVDDVDDYLRSQGGAVGKTTIYRYLDKLVEEGTVQKFVIADGKSACYQLLKKEADCRTHFHLKCVGCGRLIHLECGYLEELRSHIGENHHFSIDSSRTVFYGWCEDCLKKQKENPTICIP